MRLLTSTCGGPHVVSRREPRAMNDRTKLLSALFGFRVRNVTLAPDGGCLVRMKGIAAGDGRSACGGCRHG